MPSIGIYNYSKLRGLIREKDYTQSDVAKALSLNPTTLSQKLCGKGVFKQNEISAVCTLLKISPDEIGKYFFTS